MNRMDESDLAQMIAQAAAEQSFETPVLDVHAAVREADRRRLGRQLKILAVGAVLMLAALAAGILLVLADSVGTDYYWLAVATAAYIGMTLPVGLAAVMLFCKRLERQQQKGVRK